MRLPRSLSGWTMAVFGALAAALGVVGLAVPDALLTVMGFEPVSDGGRAEGDHTLVFLTASSMAALNMGVYYVLAALADWKAFFRWTVPFRLLTCAVFTLAVVAGRAPPGSSGWACGRGSARWRPGPRCGTRGGAAPPRPEPGPGGAGRAARTAGTPAVRASPWCGATGRRGAWRRTGGHGGRRAQ